MRTKSVHYLLQERISKEITGVPPIPRIMPKTDFIYSMVKTFVLRLM